MSIGAALNKPKKGRLQGAVALLVLKTLNRGSMHGYGIPLHIQAVSKEFLRVEEGSLYPALHRMEQDGWASAERGASQNKSRARYYPLTPTDRRQADHEEHNWQRLLQALPHGLQYASQRIG